MSISVIIIFETSVYYVHLTRLIAREDYIKSTDKLMKALKQWWIEINLWNEKLIHTFNTKNVKERDHFVDFDVDEITILEWILQK
jgi:hypothetical protein